MHVHFGTCEQASDSPRCERASFARDPAVGPQEERVTTSAVMAAWRLADVVVVVVVVVAWMSVRAFVAASTRQAFAQAFARRQAQVLPPVTAAARDFVDMRDLGSASL